MYALGVKAMDRILFVSAVLFLIVSVLPSTTTGSGVQVSVAEKREEPVVIQDSGKVQCGCRCDNHINTESKRHPVRKSVQGVLRLIGGKK